MSVAVDVSWQQALTWRMERQLLDPVGRLSSIVDRDLSAAISLS